MTFDPYTNRVPWELLTEEEREPFEKADIEDIRVWTGFGWPKKARDPYGAGSVYRLAQPKIDYCFDLLDDKFEWAATDWQGTVRLYEAKPIIASRGWNNCGGAIATIPRGLKRYPTLPTGVDWKDSLRRRGE